MDNHRGRPRKEQYDKTLRVNITDKMNQDIAKMTLVTGKSRADIVREGISILSSCKFGEMLSEASMEWLQSCSEESWKLLHTEGCIFETDKFSNRMPGYICKRPDCNMVVLKYPTYAIRVMDLDGDEDFRQNLSDRLRDIRNIGISPHMEECCRLSNSIGESKYELFFDIVCLEVDLNLNREIKDNILYTLQSDYTVIARQTQCYRKARIEFIDKEQKYFKVIDERRNK